MRYHVLLYCRNIATAMYCCPGYVLLYCCGGLLLLYLRWHLLVPLSGVAVYLLLLALIIQLHFILVGPKVCTHTQPLLISSHCTH